MIFNLLKRAKDIFFKKDNTELQADNVQDALEEIANDYETSEHADDTYLAKTDANVTYATKTELNGKFNIPKIQGQNFRVYALSSSNINSLPSESEWSIGMGLWDNQSYVAFNCAWIDFQFKVNSSGIQCRYRFGNSGWKSWVNI